MPGGLPVGGTGVGAAVVVEAIGPVGFAERWLFEAGDLAHARPGVGVGRAGEDETIVEEDGFDFFGGHEDSLVRWASPPEEPWRAG